MRGIFLNRDNSSAPVATNDEHRLMQPQMSTQGDIAERAPIDEPPESSMTNAFHALTAQADTSRSIRYPQSTPVFLEGDQCTTIFLLVSGTVTLRRGSGDGRDLIVALRHSGAILGLNAAVLQSSHGVTALTVGQCELLRVPASALQGQDLVNSELHRWTAKILAIEQQEMISRWAELTLSLRERLEWAICDLAVCVGRSQPNGDIRLALHLTQNDFADLVAASRERVSRQLAAMEVEGTIRRRDGWMIIPHESRLSNRRVGQVQKSRP